MIIVFEGADCLGKTTLANRVSNLLGIPVVKKDFSWVNKEDLTGSKIEEYARVSASALMQLAGSTDFIVDRMAMSSIAYSHAYKRVTDLDWAHEAIADADVCFVVLLSHDDEKWSQRLRLRGEKLIDREKLRLIDSEFRSIVGDYDDVLSLNAFSGSVDEMALSVIDYFRELRG